GMPHAGALDRRDPDFAAFLAKVDLRAGDSAIMAGARERHAHILGAVLEDRHHDGVLFPRKVKKKILAGQLDLVDRDFAGIEKNVVGEKVRQNGETAGTLES